MDDEYRKHSKCIHQWIRVNYGPARRCEFRRRHKVRERRSFQWALKRGRMHEKNIEHYLQLCNKCHWHYDNPMMKKRLIHIRITETDHRRLKLLALREGVSLQRAISILFSRRGSGVVRKK